jgi:hypothetical protein
MLQQPYNVFVRSDLYSNLMRRLFVRRQPALGLGLGVGVGLGLGLGVGLGV